jgi:glycosyltransferase involved in cell wall biosynthesis
MKVWLPTVRAGSGADVFSERLASALTAAGCKAIVTWLPHWVELFPPVGKTAPPEKVDVIHANTWSAFAFTGAGLPMVATEHGYVGEPYFRQVKTWKQRAYHALIKRYVHTSLGYCDRVTAVSDHVADSIRPFCRRPPAVVPNWVDTDVFFPRPRARFGPFRVLYAGSRARHKGFDAVQALVRYKLPGIELWCPRDLAPHLPNAICNLVLYDRVSSHIMPSMYANVDAVLFPSRYEGFGYVAAEAMACGRPVVGFDVPSVRWLCGEAALLVPPGDVSALKGVLSRLQHDRGLCAQLEQAGRINILQRFNRDSAVSNYIRIYRELIS